MFYQFMIIYKYYFYLWIEKIGKKKQVGFFLLLLKFLTVYLKIILQFCVILSFCFVYSKHLDEIFVNDHLNIMDFLIGSPHHAYKR